MRGKKRSARFWPALVIGLLPGVATAGCEGTRRIPGAADRYLVLAEGDSITAGQQSSDGRSYVQRACLLSANGIETVVAAKSRAVMGSPHDAPGSNSLWGRMAADNAILAQKKGKRVAILTVLIGRNDLVGYGGGEDAYADDLARYVAAMKRAGWDRVVVGTLLPSTWPAFDFPRTNLNAILTTPGWAGMHGVDAIADFAASPEMGFDGEAADTAYYADGIHPNDRGYETLAPIYGKAVATAMAAVR